MPILVSAGEPEVAPLDRGLSEYLVVGYLQLKDAGFMDGYKKFPYRVEFPDSSEYPRNSQTLEDALSWARWNLHRVWKEDGEWGKKGQPTTDVETAVITNRNTGYRWILRRESSEVESQTPEMLEKQ